MGKLTIEKKPCSAGLDTMKITGFGDGELAKLKSLPHGDAMERLIDMLNARNNMTGTRWMCGNGVYGLWFDNEAAYLNVGTSCD